MYLSCIFSSGVEMGLRRAFEVCMSVNQQVCMSVNPQQAPQDKRWSALSKTEVKDHVGRRNYISNARMNMRGIVEVGW